VKIPDSLALVLDYGGLDLIQDGEDRLVLNQFFRNIGQYAIDHQSKLVFVCLQGGPDPVGLNQYQGHHRQSEKQGYDPENGPTHDPKITYLIVSFRVF
jgi:hypothetical protein